MTAWYTVLLTGALLFFGLSAYLGLERYLNWNLQRTLTEEVRSIGTQLLVAMPQKRPDYLTSEIDEAYAPEVYGRFIRVTRSDGALVYVSGRPKDDSFDPSRVPRLPLTAAGEYPRRVEIPGGPELLVEGAVFTNPDGSRFLVESGVPYQQIGNVLHGLLLTFAFLMPFTVSLALAGGYWLMRRALRPIDNITTRAEGITSTHLSERLPVIQTGDELERLSTSLNRMIARLDDAFQQINRFSADASHELRTPLTILNLELEGIAQSPRLPADLADQIGSALEETHRLSWIVENLLTIARLDAGELRMEKAALDLGELASSTADQMRLLAEEKSLSMLYEVTRGLLVDGDRPWLKQVVVNLIDNAIKYTPEGGSIEIRVHRSQNAAVLEVIDSGVGISAESLPHLFERFYRADKARSRNSGGAGLGLAIVKAICSAHGAEIRIMSTEGRGSTFVVELPLASTRFEPLPASGRPVVVGLRD
jgi:heavy metal sensor kinase